MRAVRVAVVGLTALLLVAAGFGSVASAQQAWAPPGTATIHPGVQTITAGGQCTANFVFTSGSNVYLGQAAHCATTGGGLDTDGCDTPSLPLGTPVAVEGATRPGVLAYSSWITMQRRGEDDPDACAFNDFALVRVHPADVGRVNPSVPVLGGPVGLGGMPSPGQQVFSFGSSSLLFGLAALGPMSGLNLGTAGAGWVHTVLALRPGLPGDSGSGVLDSAGRAVGVLTTLRLLPIPLTNGVANLSKVLGYLNAYGPFDVALAPGTVPFRGNPLPLGT
ncbi:MAG TPA: hypothetical protein VG078_09460 [Acidimicrobiales bacterium]|nr:hypothetical protein [Acidimicrobiales bacterium]